MDGRAGAKPTETNGAVAGDKAPGGAAPGTADEARRLPLTIREVVRRGRKDLDEIERLRAQVDELRVRAESAEQLLEAAPKEAERVGPAFPARNGHGAGNGHDKVNGFGKVNGHDNAKVNGHDKVNGQGGANGDTGKNGHSHANGRAVAPSTVNGWAPAAMLPRSRRA